MSTCVTSRNWLAYVCEAMVAGGSMPSWEATEYLTGNLFGECPNPRLHETKSPYEAISQFLQRLYHPLVEAATREVELPPSAMVHAFTDISLIGNSAVLVVYFPGENRPHQLLILDAVKAWEVVFPDADAFNAWAEERFRWIVDGLKTAVARIDKESVAALR